MTKKNTKKPLRTPNRRSKTLDSIEISERTVERLAQYRRILLDARTEGQLSIFSHEIATRAGANSAQVRRDLMEVGYLGHPRHGYEVAGLLTKIDRFFLTNKGIQIALVGVGNLGRAILSYFSAKGAQFSIIASFDSDPSKHGRTICGAHCHPIEQAASILAGKTVDVCVIAVPAGEAQRVTDIMLNLGVRGFLNLAPVHLKIPPSAYVEDFDLTRSIEKVAFYTKKYLQQARTKP